MTNILMALNFILLFLLADFINAIHNNYLIKIFKRGIIVVAALCVMDALLCIIAYLWNPFLILMCMTEAGFVFIILFAKKRGEKLSWYSGIEAGKEGFFGNQEVMVIVPHEDDELNLLGGVIEEYIKHSSKIFVVFSTNGDGRERNNPAQSGQIRMREAIEVLGLLGVPEENVIFLGYGDGWSEEKGHIYNCPNEEIIQSAVGRTATYGLDTHPAYHEGRAYTRSNYLSDIKEIILEHKPDVIYCIDYDSHNDHRALSLMFERVMGEILHDTDYRPEVYKAFAYRTAWNAPRDYNDSVNILSTVEHTTAKDISFYNWEDRIRIPIDARSVNRVLERSKLYKALELYPSQHAQLSADSIINGDKAVWKRRTDSLCYDAKVTVSSGDASKLTDFMMLDSNDLYNRGDHPWDGVWHPAPDDSEKKIRVEFPCPRFVEQIILYDSPSPNDNVVDAEILLDGKTLLHSGRLKEHGQATSIDVNRVIQYFEIRLTRTEGDCYGLTEIEAFSNSDIVKSYCKIVDDAGNFVYDYILHSSGKQRFAVYRHSDTHQGFIVSCSNKKCSVVMHENTFEVDCPCGKECIVSVKSEDNGPVNDAIRIRSLSYIDKMILKHWIIVKQNKLITKSYVHRVINKTMKEKER